MGYGDDVRAFMDRLTESPLSAQERCLWERIRWMFDRAGDPKRLPIATFVLMEAEKMTEPTFRRARKKLEKEGLIRVESVKGQAALYELLPIIKDRLREPSFEPSTEPSEEASREPSEGASGEAAEGHARARDNTYVSGISKNNIIYYNTLPNLSHGTLNEPRVIWEREIRRLFEEFWALYPRKESRHDAWLEWVRIFEGGDVEFEAIMEGLMSATSSRQWNQGGQGRFVPNPARWLREKRWEDVMEPDKALEELPF